MTQERKTFKVADLRLWTENPRDPINKDATDDDVISRAITSSKNKDKAWQLDKLIKQMGDWYDFSELPTVVIDNEIPVVYDGNRRITVLKCLQNEELYKQITGTLTGFANPPQELVNLTEIDCNVCDKQTALQNVWRKHHDSGSWSQLQRDIFRNKYFGESKSNLLVIDEATGIISENDKMNQRFVGEEVVKDKNLNAIGLKIEEDKLKSNYDEDTTKKLLDNIVSAVSDKKINTRGENRGNLPQALQQVDPEFAKTLSSFNEAKSQVVQFPQPVRSQANKPTTRRFTPTTKQNNIIFGEKLELKQGKVNDIYRGIVEIYGLYNKNQDLKSYLLPIVCMSLRLLYEVCAREYYLTNNFELPQKVLEEFDKLAKKELKELTDNTLLNDKSLLSEWLDSNKSFKAILDKYAHGVVTADRDGALRQSRILGIILKKYFGKG
ncbi:MAG: hypothetical protein LBM13_04335 [Candidatus Ancillula sp.]|jgi:hypothetical protein|nr:hypothetical protein [Candidatus Ancillula sp.]